MANANIRETFDCDLQTVWDIVTDLHNYEWRSDIDRIEIVDNKTFIEHTKDGFRTTFIITVAEPCKRYEFEMDNENMHGHWRGIFSEADGRAVLDFTEDVTAKKLIMKPLVGAYLRKQQKLYISDLKKSLVGTGGKNE